MVKRTLGSVKLATRLYVIDEKPESRNKFGEVESSKWEVVYYADNVEHYPKSRQGVTGDILATSTTEVALSYEIAWIEPNNCQVIDLCNTDIQDGMYCVLKGKVWKLVGINNIDDDCDDDMDTLRLILERIEPREAPRGLKECASCFDLQFT